MRQLFTALLVLLIVFMLNPQAYSAEEENDVILSINPVGMLLLGLPNFEVEKIINPQSGIVLFYAQSGQTPGKIGDVYYTGSEERITYRRYFKNTAPAGAWGGLSLAYSTSDVWTENNYGYYDEYILNTSAIALSIEAGARWWFKDFNISPIVMYRVLLTDNFFGEKQTSGDVKTPAAGFGIGLNIGIGL